MYNRFSNPFVCRNKHVKTLLLGYPYTLYVARKFKLQNKWCCVVLPIRSTFPKFFEHILIYVHHKLRCFTPDKLSRDARYPVFGGSDKARHKPVCIVTDKSLNLESLGISRGGNVL